MKFRLKELVAIIGTRNPSDEGIRKTKEIVKNLVKENCIIVSGLARGIDTVAHRTAIEWGGKTIAVLGTEAFCYEEQNDGFNIECKFNS